MFETIFLHVGLPKTGSTHVQDGMQCLSNAGLLRRVAYPVVSPDIGSGNGANTSDVLLSAMVDEDVRARLDSCLGDLLKASRGHAGSLLISSEHFFFATVEAFACLKQMLLRHARSVKLVICVRPVKEWTWSLYMQLVKAHALAEAYDHQWLTQCGATYLPYFRNLDQFDTDAVVFGYRGAGLFRQFLGLLGEDEGLASQFSDQRVNRSLSAGELDLVRKVNASFGDSALSRAISNRFIRDRPDQQSSAPPAGCEEDFRRFASDFGRELDLLRGPALSQVRELLFAGPEVSSDVSRAGAKIDDRDLLGIALQEIRRLQDAYRAEGLQCHAMKKYAKTMQPTKDFFDPVHYLLMYPDLAIPEIDPEVHFRNHGLKEGRASGLKGRHIK